MSKQQVLTEIDVERYTLNPEIVRYLERFCDLHSMAPADVRVLDFGCGRGEAVVKLRNLGYDAVGADIDPVALENGRRYLTAVGFEESCLRLIEDSGRLDAPDGHFHFVFSETVFEHVRDLDAVAAEMSRIMATPSAALHVFPSQYHLVEQHLGMPFVHWLPKNALRTAAISFYTRIGVEPRWENEGFAAKVRRYDRYSAQNTFYRGHGTLRETFEKHGLVVDYVSVDHPKLATHPILGRLSRLPVGRSLLNKLILNFKTVELLLHKSTLHEQRRHT